MAIGRLSYMQMAVNLARSIKDAIPTAKVTVISDRTIPAIFDNSVPVPVGTNPFQAKTRLYTLTKASEMLFLDADSVVACPKAFQENLNGLEGLAMFSDLEQSPWTSEGVLNYNSSVIYWKRSREVGKWFKEAEKQYKTMQSRYLIGGNNPDELAFSLATEKLGYGPQSLPENFLHLGGKASAKQIKQYGLLTLAGNGISTNAVNTYNGISRALSRKYNADFHPFSKSHKNLISNV